MKAFMDLDANLKLRAFTVFLTVLLSSSIGPNMTFYYLKYFGSFWTGVLLVIVSLAGFLGSLYGGHLADAWGRRPTMLVGASLMIGGYGLATLANSPWLISPEVTFLGFLIAMAGGSLADPADQAMMIDVSTPQNRQFVFALIYWIVNIGVMIGAAIGGWFFRDYLYYLLLGMSGGAFINYLVIYFGMRETFTGQVENQAKTVKQAVLSYLTVLQDRRYTIFSVGAVLSIVIYSQIDYYLPAHLNTDFHTYWLWAQEIYGQRMLSLMLITNTALIIVFMGLVNHYSTTWPLTRGFALGQGLQGIGIALTFVLGDFWPLILATVIWTLGEIIVVPASQTIRADLMDPNKIGAYSGLFSVTRPIGTVIAGGMVSLSAVINKWGMAVIVVLMAVGAIGLTLKAVKMPQGNRGKKAISSHG